MYPCLEKSMGFDLKKEKLTFRCFPTGFSRLKVETPGGAVKKMFSIFIFRFNDRNHDSPIWEISFGYSGVLPVRSVCWVFAFFFKFQNYTLKFSLKIQISKLSGKSNNILWQNSAFSDFGSSVLWKLNSASYMQNSMEKHTPQTKNFICLPKLQPKNIIF